ncbi:interferon regulatory factor 4-like [Acropora millepora]|uniref:interferon regulatory factor 4-like n=1 Tax=Acropora millepora TaxID=45264 RepID=UPI001CF448E6|nr:interferon regulatory factor 4-like [Acropora millepora]
MYAERQRLRPWLEDKINSGKVPGLCWRDREKKEFRVSWKHAGKPDFNYEKDAMLFKLWAEHTGKYHHGEPPHPSAWKTRFRCALHKMPDVVEVRVPHSLDEKDPYRVFRFTAKAYNNIENVEALDHGDPIQPHFSMPAPETKRCIFIR